MLCSEGGSYFIIIYIQKIKVTDWLTAWLSWELSSGLPTPSQWRSGFFPSGVVTFSPKSRTAHYVVFAVRNNCGLSWAHFHASLVSLTYAGKRCHKVWVCRPRRWLQCTHAQWRLQQFLTGYSSSWLPRAGAEKMPLCTGRAKHPPQTRSGDCTAPKDIEAPLALPPSFPLLREGDWARVVASLLQGHLLKHHFRSYDDSGKELP